MSTKHQCRMENGKSLARREERSVSRQGVSRTYHAVRRTNIRVVVTRGDGVEAHKRGRGRPPSKEISSKEKAMCPCNVKPDAGWIGCDNCPKWWHLPCLGLAGLAQETVKSLANWSCSECFYSPHGRYSKLMRVNTPSGKESSAGKEDCSTMRIMVKEELNILQPTTSNKSALIRLGRIRALSTHL